MGFVIDREADVDPKTLASFPYLVKNIPPEMMEKMGKMEKMNAIWRLKVEREGHKGTKEHKVF
jgi:hypothetical protein